MQHGKVYPHGQKGTSHKELVQLPARSAGPEQARVAQGARVPCLCVAQGLLRRSIFLLFLCCCFHGPAHPDSVCGMTVLM